MAAEDPERPHPTPKAALSWPLLTRLPPAAEEDARHLTIYDYNQAERQFAAAQNLRQALAAIDALIAH